MNNSNYILFKEGMKIKMKKESQRETGSDEERERKKEGKENREEKVCFLMLIFFSIS